MDEDLELVIQKNLRKNLSFDYISFCEYQDKYFLLKKLRSLFPKFTDNAIYNALDSFSEEERKKIKLSRFIEKFSKVITREYFSANTSNRE